MTYDAMWHLFTSTDMVENESTAKGGRMIAGCRHVIAYGRLCRYGTAKGGRMIAGCRGRDMI